jgi:REP element-mobilizing transposase RayT
MSAPRRGVFQPFTRHTERDVTQRHLPHWTRPGASYFVTFRLADSLPQPLLAQWKSEREIWLKAHGVEHQSDLSDADLREYHKHFTQRMEMWFDQGMGSCVLARRDAGEIVEGALRFFDDKRCILDEFIVMPNHVHLLVLPLDEWTLSKLLHSWKRHTALEINKLRGEEGALWFDESYDHIVRSWEQLEIYRRYIRENPVKAKLTTGRFRLGKGSGIEPPDTTQSNEPLH